MIDSVVIKLLRKGVGIHPDYSLTITGEGKVIYEGIKNVEVKGERRKNINKNSIINLIKDFKDIDFFSLNDIYPSEKLQDFPYTTISLHIKDENNKVIEKSITHYHGDKKVPKKLIELENKIDDITDSKKWVGIPDKILSEKIQPSSKKIDTIVSKHEKIAIRRKKTYSSKMKIIGNFLIIIVLIAILFIFFYIFSISDLTKNDMKNEDTISPLVIINADPKSGDLPLIVNFTGSGQNFNGILSYKWDFGDGLESKQQNPKHTFYNPGIYNVSLVITDETGVNASEVIQIIAYQENLIEPFTVYILTDPETPQGLSPFNVSFSPLMSGGTYPYYFSWDFGDGNNSTSPIPYYCYINEGIYTVKLTVTDDHGDIATDEVEIICNK